MLHLTNRHLLYRTGAVADETLSTDLGRLLVSGIAELDRRFDRRIASVENWLVAAEHPDAQLRRQLANATSYLARDAYSLGSSDSLSTLTDVLSRFHVDLLVQIPGFGMIPFTRSDDRLHAVILSAVRSTEDALLSMRDAGRKDIPTSSWATVLNDLERSVVGLGASGAMDRARDAKQHSQQLEATAEPSPLERCRAARLSGGMDVALELLGRAGPVDRMTLDQLHEYMTSASVLMSRSELDVALFAVRDRLRLLSEEHLGTVTFLARALQFDDLTTDHVTLENSNEAFDRFSVNPATPEEDQQPRPVLVLAIDQCRITPGLVAPLSVMLRASGASFYNLQHNRLTNSVVTPWPYSPRLSADSAAIIGVETGPDEFLCEWTTDLENGVLVTEGVNYYQGLYERVGRKLKVYDVDWGLPAARTYARQWIRQLDRTVFALNGVREAAEQRALPVRFVTAQSHFAPWSAYRVYASAHPQFLEHITVSSSYENWATNMSGEPLSTLALLNNTRRPSPSLPAFGTAEGFRRFLNTEHSEHRERHERQADELTRMERAGAPSTLTSQYVDLMRSDRQSGKIVFCLLGKIPYDLAVPYQGGPAHDSMGDWLNHTVSVIGSAERSVLYVKPHPHELNTSIAARPRQAFVELIRESDTDHVVVLPHRGVNLQHLLPVVDVFLVWNGSSIAELGSQGANVVACDDWAALNYPIDVFLPEDRHHYEAILTGRRSVEMSPRFEELSKAHIAFLTSAPFSFDCPMVHRSSTNTMFNSARVQFAEFTIESLESLDARRPELLEVFGFPGSDLL